MQMCVLVQVWYPYVPVYVKVREHVCGGQLLSAVFFLKPESLISLTFIKYAKLLSESPGVCLSSTGITGSILCPDVFFFSCHDFSCHGLRPVIMLAQKALLTELSPQPERRNGEDKIGL